MDRVAFGRRLYTLRREQHLTTERFSELCDVTAVFIRQIERGAKLPSLPMFVRMCNKLRISPGFFLADSLVWDEEDEIAALDKKLRTLSLRQFATVMDTINTLIDKLTANEEAADSG